MTPALLAHHHQLIRDADSFSSPPAPPSLTCYPRTTKKLLASTAYSTTKVLIAGSFDYNLAVSDAVTFDATIVGTSPAFGDSTLPSSVTINRIA